MLRKLQRYLICARYEVALREACAVNQLQHALESKLALQGFPYTYIRHRLCGSMNRAEFQEFCAISLRACHRIHRLQIRDPDPRAKVRE